MVTQHGPVWQLLATKRALSDGWECAEEPTQLFLWAATTNEMIPIGKTSKPSAHTWGYLFIAWFQTVVQNWFDCFNAEKPTAMNKLYILK